jgi:3-phosphoshikimate 1-carboxyvinyltransferase
VSGDTEPTDRRLIEPLVDPVDANVTVPGSKSYTNRALVCAALAQGTSMLVGALASDDTAAMLDCLACLGIVVGASPQSDTWTVAGCGGHLPRQTASLSCRLSGTTARFITPLACLGDGPYRIGGAAPLQARPMADQFAALRSLGAAITTPEAPDHLPAFLERGSFRGGSVSVAGNVSSQFLSGLLLAAPCYPAGIDVTVTTELVSRSYVDLTLDSIAAFGGRVSSATDDRFVVATGGYRAGHYVVEPDASAASYFFAAAAVTGGRVRVNGLRRASRQGDVALVDILAAMGCAVNDTPHGLEVIGPEQLHGVEVDMRDCSDVAQTLAAIAPFADSPTRITGIGFIRRKETDRIAAVVNELRRCGIQADEEADGILIRPGVPRPAEVHTYDDHRMAMSFALLGLRVPGITILDPSCVAKTFPTYWAVLDGLRN